MTRIRAIVALHVLVHAESAHPCLCHDLARYACSSRLGSLSVIPDGSGGASAFVCSAQPRATRSPIGVVPRRNSAGRGTPVSFIAVRSRSLAPAPDLLANVKTTTTFTEQARADSEAFRTR